MGVNIKCSAQNRANCLKDHDPRFGAVDINVPVARPRLHLSSFSLFPLHLLESFADTWTICWPSMMKRRWLSGAMTQVAVAASSRQGPKLVLLHHRRKAQRKRSMSAPFLWREVFGSLPCLCQVLCLRAIRYSWVACKAAPERFIVDQDGWCISRMLYRWVWKSCPRWWPSNEMHLQLPFRHRIGQTGRHLDIG